MVAKITSKGADGTLSTSDDRFVEILKREVFATVTGTVISPDGSALEDASVSLNTPVNGVLTMATTMSDASGNYSFSDVAFGVGSIEVEATATTGSGTSGIGYVENSAVTISSNTKVQFQVNNLGENDVTLTMIKIEFTGSSKFYDQIDWSGTVVWDSATDGGGIRGGSGETKTLSSSQTIVGTSSAAASSTKLLRVEESSTTADTVTLGTGAGTGGQVTITVGPFFSNPTGGGTSSMKGRTFTITFSDGSVVTFFI